MIILYTGVPGSGKSYKMVHDLAAFLDKQDITVISNIRNLKLPHEDFEKLLDDLFPGLKLIQQVEKFFEYEHQQKLNEDYGGPIMYVLDECQLYFPRAGRMPNTEAYLQRHRHLGHFIYLASQSSSLVNKNFIPLIETEYHAARRTISFFGEIHYKEKSPQSRQIIRSITLKPKREIFDLYQSFEAAEIKKPKPVLLRYFWLPLLLLPFFYLFYAKFLRVPVREEKVTTVDVSVDATNALQERKKLEAIIEKLETTVDLLVAENSSLKASLNQKVRVLLPVVQVNGKKLTVDPDTGAVMEPAKLRDRQVVCINGGLTCYYDQPVQAAVKLANENDYYRGSAIATGASTLATQGLQRKADSAGPGSFIDASIVPPPAPVSSGTRQPIGSRENR